MLMSFKMSITVTTSIFGCWRQIKFKEDEMDRIRKEYFRRVK